MIDVIILAVETLINLVISHFIIKKYHIALGWVILSNFILFSINATFVGSWFHVIPKKVVIKKFKGKKILVTGSSSGIGHALCETLKEYTEGDCKITGMNRTDVKESVDNVIITDFSKPESAAQIEKEISNGGYDYAFLCSGYADIFNRNTEHEHRVMNVNFNNQIIPALQANIKNEKKVKILAISSLNSDVATPGGESYAASKAAMTKYCIACKEASVVFPGGVNTNFHSVDTMIDPKTNKLAQDKEKTVTKPKFVAEAMMRVIGNFKTAYIGIDSVVVRMIEFIIPEWLLIRIIYKV